MNVLLTKTRYRTTFSSSPGPRFEISPLSGFPKPGPPPTFTILWVMRGKASCRVDMRELEIADNQLVCISPGKATCIDAIGCQEGYMISFSEVFLNVEERELDLSYEGGLFRIFSDPDTIPLPAEIGMDMKRIFEGMKKESENLYPYRDQLIRKYLKIFLIHLSRQRPVETDNTLYSRGKELTRAFMKLLEKNYRQYRSVSEYARHLSVTPNHLNVAVKKNTGNTAGHCIKQRLVLEAQRLIVYSDLCMKEIADDLGFSDTAHFSKFFKNGCGMNFSDFKREKWKRY
jgi:AraC-like DNA-binding protein